MIQSIHRCCIVFETISTTYTSWFNADNSCGTLPVIPFDDKLSCVMYVRREKLVGRVSGDGVNVNDKPL